ncbi:nucleotidyltransferase family protein [Silvanigrella sp.]|jgi:mannose-1-phosphate guanylyltransferase|uniref:nucleotidyltransferase family protein n=1 Tax=Silvanigrella sp. TaxID=2024976 RepID=UPI0037C7FE69
MKAMLLAAGYGTRLRPLTDKTPKCLLPIKGKPLLQIWVDNLIEAGIKNILINTHYLSDQVNEFFEKNDYSKYVSLVYEKELLGTAGTLIKNIDFFENDEGFLIHSDNFCLENLSSFINSHLNRPKESIMTMMTFRTNTPEQCGIVELNEHSLVINFHEKKLNSPGNLANGAIYLMSKEFLTDLKRNHFNKNDFSCEILNQYLGKIYSFETRKIFIDIGNIINYNYVNNINF